MKINLEKIKKEKSLKELLEFGIINIDKPRGPTSFKVDEIVKKKLNLRKTSHFGTLDPNVTGVLPIALNRACKLLGWFISKEKKYVGVMKLHKEISKKELEKEIKEFVGKIKQLPPVKSRVKREERIREVYLWKLLEYDKEKNEVLFEVEVQAGTYIRKLIHDLGLKIGGAHMVELRRVKAGIFDEKESITLYGLEKKIKENKLKEIIIPAEIISEILPVVEVKKQSIKRLLTGKPIFKEDVKGEVREKEGNVAVFSELKFIEIAKMVKEGNILAKPEFVFN